MLKGPEKPDAGAPASGNERRILRAAERLFAQRGYRNVTIRDIAKQARVTHPLIYHYFGSKRGLFAAVLAQNQSRMRGVIAPDPSPRELILALARANLVESRSYLLALSRAFADGMRPADWPGGFPGVDAICERLVGESRGDDPPISETEARQVTAIVTALSVGWALVEDQVLEIVGLSEADREGARERLLEAIGDLVDLALQGDDG